MTDINIIGVLEACNSLANKIITVGGERHDSSFLFKQCMRAFDKNRLPAQSITFSVFLDTPLLCDGEATIYRNGHMEIRRT